MRVIGLLATVLFAAPLAAQPALWVPAPEAALSPRQAAFLDAFASQPGVESWAVGLVQIEALNGEAVQIAALDLDISLQRQSVSRHQKGPAAGAVSWAGASDAAGEVSSAVFVSRDQDLTGAIWADGGVWEIRPLTEGLHAIARLATDELRDHDDDWAAFARQERELPLAPEAAAVSGEESVVDVLIAFTPEVSLAVADPVALAQSAVDATNMVHENSDVPMRLALVHAYETPDVGTTSTSTDLSDLRSIGDGRFEEVHTLRDAFGADVVALLGPTSGTYGSCGRGYVRAGESDAFTVTAFNCAVGNLTFAHEVGHNMGALHDPFVEGSTYVGYDHGYVNIPGQWRTVMAYRDECEAQNVGCTRVPYWSSPDVDYPDQTPPVQIGPTGDASLRNNARVHTERGPVVAAFRATLDPPVSGYGPLTLEATLASGEDGGVQINLENMATGGAAPLSYTVHVENLAPAPSTPPELDCLVGTVYAHTRAIFPEVVTAGGSEWGQSWTAPCTGQLVAVIPAIAPGRTNAVGETWRARLSVFNGAGGTGLVVGGGDIENVNADTDIEDIRVPMDVAPEVVAGDVYTWFLDMQEGTTGVWRAQGSFDGDAYATTTGLPQNATPQDPSDLRYALELDPPQRWVNVERGIRLIGPGENVQIPVSLRASALDPGTYTADVVVQTNDPQRPSFRVPLALTVLSSTDQEPRPTQGIVLQAPAPNPARGRGVLRLSVSEAGPVRVEVLSARGRRVALPVDQYIGAGEHQVVVDTRAWAPGVYTVRVRSHADVTTAPWVIIR